MVRGPTHDLAHAARTRSRLDQPVTFLFIDPSVMARVNCHIVPFFFLHSFFVSFECILISSNKGNIVSSDMIVLSDDRLPNPHEVE